MGARVYRLLDITNSKVNQAAQTLRDNDGVKIVEVLEGSPNIIIMIQARNRAHLANLTSHALASVDTITESVQLLPTQNGNNTQINERDSSKQQNKMLIVRGK